MRFRPAWLAPALAACAFAGDLFAHGGGYPPPPQPPLPPPRIGPGDTTPPAGGPRHGGPGAAGPAVPTTPAAGGPAGPLPARGTSPPSPTTPGPAGPAGPTPLAGSRTPTGITLEADATTWELWWEMHAEPYLQIKRSVWGAGVQTGSDEFFLGNTRRLASIDRLRPTKAEVEGRILPALQRALGGDPQRDVVTACMIAVAKTGGDDNGRLVGELLVPRLCDLDQEIRETAALAIGISGRAEAENLQLLAALALDRPAGRQACRRAEVDDRVRAFACYALGLAAGAGGDAATRHRAASTLIALVEDQKLSSRNVRVAAAAALGLVESGRGDSAAANALVDRAVQALATWLERPAGRGDELVLAHAPPAIGRLLGKGRPAAAAWRQRFSEMLAATDSRRRSAPLAQSCALALGDLCAPIEGEDSRDFATGVALLRTWREHPDAQTRYFAAMSLARIGGSWCRSALLEDFPRAGRAIEQPWLAIALGVVAFERRQHGELDRDVGELLRSALRAARNPSAQGAFAIGLGLCGHEPAADELAALLHDARDDGVRGYVAIALALLGHRAAGADLRELLQRSLRRPELLSQAAIALSVLGDRSTVDELMRQLEGETNLARLAAVATAIGRIGDRRAIDRLVELLGDPGQTALARAFAAAALGGVADRQVLPWHTDLRGYVNYRAAVETLWDGTAGILDIL